MRVFLTGASSGIGEALARHYAGPGSVLGLAGRRLEALRGLADSLEGEAHVYPFDLSDTAALAAAAKDFTARFGAPDLVIANAGISVGTQADAFAELPKLLRHLEVNLVGLAATLAVFAPAMRAAGRGTLAGIASVAGFRGIPGSAAYSASKAAAIAWLESLRTELHGTGVAVVCVCPGYVDTPMTRVNRYRMPFLLSPEAAARRIAKAIAAKRRCAVIPWQMAAASRLLQIVPGWLYDRLAARAPRKPRDLPF